MDIVALITGFVKLAYQLLLVWLEDRQEKKEAAGEAKKKQKSFDEIAAIALRRMKAENKKAAQQHQDFQDRLDEKERRK